MYIPRDKQEWAPPEAGALEVSRTGRTELGIAAGKYPDNDGYRFPPPPSNTIIYLQRCLTWTGRGFRAPRTVLGARRSRTRT